MIKVAAAIIENDDGLILIAKRNEEKSLGGYWEFPGGKIEEGETIEACLQRELLEEMNIHITPYQFFAENDHDYGDFHIHLVAYKAQYIKGEISLVDHDEYKWIHPKSLTEFNFAPADIKFVELLQ